jgi:phosphoribosylformylglycinamidine cyclo-ligase
MASRYERTGVDVHKKGIEVFQSTIRNIFPRAFCVVTPDPDFPEYGLILHKDGTGSKPITNWLLSKEFGNNNYFKSIANDAIAMNIDDTDCVDSKPLSFVDGILINQFTTPKTEFCNVLNEGIKESLDMLKRYDINLYFGGGETEDVPDQIRTVAVLGTIVARVKLEDAIKGDKIEPGNYIVGARSGGKAIYEDKENSGLMCNGVTLARHCLIHHDYEIKYPEIRDPKGSPYTGRFKLDQHLDEVGTTPREVLTSPTRIFSPITKKILEHYKDDITGIVHNTQEGQTKILKLGKNIHYIKSNLSKPDSIFYLIQKESGEPWREMFLDFNCGIGMEYIVKNLETAEGIISIAESFGVDAKLLGNKRKSDGSNKLTIHTEFGKLTYP